MEAPLTGRTNRSATAAVLAYTLVFPTLNARARRALPGMRARSNAPTWADDHPA
jgi:hypothetical protein